MNDYEEYWKEEMRCEAQQIREDESRTREKQNSLYEDMDDVWGLINDLVGKDLNEKDFEELISLADDYMGLKTEFDKIN